MTGTANRFEDAIEAETKQVSVICWIGNGSDKGAMMIAADGTRGGTANKVAVATAIGKL